MPQARAVLEARCIRSLAVCLVALAGCDSLSDQGVAARAGDWVLTEQRLADLLVQAQPFPVDSTGAAAIAELWVAAAAVAQRAAAGDSLLGSEATRESLWLDRRDAILTADRVERLGASAFVDRAEARGVFDQGALRLIAHVLRRVGPEMSSSERRLQRQTADRLLATIAEGGGWGDVVAESEDAATRARGGLMGLFAAGELPLTLDRAAFRLSPGTVSGVVESARGFHILYRPRFDEAATLFTERLIERNLVQADAGAADGARTARGFELAPGAAVVLARMAVEPAEWLDSRQVLATWQAAEAGVGASGGASAGSPPEGRAAAAQDDAPRGVLPASVVARVVVSLPPEARAELAAATEADRELFLNDVGTQQLRLDDALDRGFALDPVVEDNLTRLHAEEVEYWTRALALDGPDGPTREGLRDYMDGVVARRLDQRALPPVFEAWLLERVEHRVRGRGLLAAAVAARGMIEQAGGAG